MPHVIRVEPLGDEWALHDGDDKNPQVFASGAKAEAAAMNLGARLADTGKAVEVRIILRDGAVAGRFVCRAAA